VNGQGIRLSVSNTNTLTNNNLSENSNMGVVITTSSNKNRIHHNNFINNNGGGIQAYDNEGTNFWNTSTEGNYLSDWTGPDVNPPYGIVDNPYILDGGSGAKDFYPLTSPVAVPDVSPAPAIMLAVILLTAIVVRRRL
jgi:parallel beta-helix repeat protein